MIKGLTMLVCTNKSLARAALVSMLIVCSGAFLAPYSWGQIGDTDAGSPSETATPKAKSEPVSEAEREEQVEKLQRRPGEKTEEGVEGRTLILGMKVRESDNHRVEVTEVAPATPAFEAGIRDGDELVAFNGFKAESYREWIDGIRKITTDAKDGDKLPLEIMRAGKTRDLRIRIPESRADELRPMIRQPGQVGYAQEGTAPGQDPIIVQQGVPYGPSYAGGGGVFVDDGSLFGDGATNSGQASNRAGRAIAHLMRVDGGTQSQPGQGARNLQQPLRQELPAELLTQVRQPGEERIAPSRAQANQLLVPGQANDAPITGDLQQGAGQRVGIAGFQNTRQGMLVIVEVGGLAPGSYHVGIGNPNWATVTAGANEIDQTGVNEQRIDQSRARQSGQGRRFTPDPNQGNQAPMELHRPPFSNERDNLPSLAPPNNSGAPNAVPPAPTSTNGGRSKQNLQQPLKQELPPDVLAQVADQLSTPPTG